MAEGAGYANRGCPQDRRRQIQADRGCARVLRQGKKLDLTRHQDASFWLRPVDASGRDSRAPFNYACAEQSVKRGAAMTKELMWLTLTIIVTGLMWVPYILDRILVRGLMGSMANPSRHDKPQSA